MYVMNHSHTMTPAAPLLTLFNAEISLINGCSDWSGNSATYGPIIATVAASTMTRCVNRSSV